MKSKIISIRIYRMIVPMFLLVSSFTFAQFNTLMPAQPQKPESQARIETIKEKGSPEQKNEKNFWKKIFNTTTKSDLKNELDSLKALMKDYSQVNNDRKARYEKMKDSLLLATQPRAEQKKDVLKNQSSQALHDFMEEPKESLSKIVMPLAGKMTVTSPYGTRLHPIFGSRKMHNGIDLKAYYENVYAVMDGIITAVGWDSKGGGNFIKVRHFNRFETAYLHLSEIYYRVGEMVKARFILGRTGNTGNSTGPHLHFSVKEFGNSINPTHFLNDLIRATHLMATYHNTGTASYKPY
ncbi:M23 family metallopeptidase [Chryseobacterium sp. OV279]|uniref:M23 family metallopeptidase n=1 Tax=Chryseobacterium sp. OV279 TaxID=1500285 RepID=UPI00091FE287|nr:M23 family metallopeptidase [Chryseobacterium sp. OV279]SHF40501.1 Murein DD-endopeptidase MepM and murein hydrolase activator NlpD, contain LysM domain [Chryseobacterium sp. OV279]